MSIFNTQESQNFRLMGNAPRSSHFDNFMTQMSKNYRSDQITPIRAQQQRGFYFYWIKVNRVFDSPENFRILSLLIFFRSQTVIVFWAEIIGPNKKLKFRDPSSDRSRPAASVPMARGHQRSKTINVTAIPPERPRNVYDHD
jgi:hypothetical protein